MFAAPINWTFLFSKSVSKELRAGCQNLFVITDQIIILTFLLLKNFFSNQIRIYISFKVEFKASPEIIITAFAKQVIKGYQY